MRFISFEPKKAQIWRRANPGRMTGGLDRASVVECASPLALWLRLPLARSSIPNRRLLAPKAAPGCRTPKPRGLWAVLSLACAYVKLPVPLLQAVRSDLLYAAVAQTHVAMYSTVCDYLLSI